MVCICRVITVVGIVLVRNMVGYYSPVYYFEVLRSSLVYLFALGVLPISHPSSKTKPRLRALEYEARI